MKNFIDIEFPKEAADNYYQNQTKAQIDDFIYIDKEWYDRIFEPSTYYILGSKGSGKTLYAAYMCGGIRKNTLSKSYTIDVGDYGRLIRMKVAHHLDFTEYLTMWKVILLQKFLLGIDAEEITFWGRTKNFREIQDAISEFFGDDVTSDSFNPVTVIDSFSKQAEVTHYINSQVNFGTTERNTPLSLSYGGNAQDKIAEQNGSSIEQASLVYKDTWLRAINAFRKTIEKVSLKYNHYLFVDGLDVRPVGIDPIEYGECIGALVRAVFELNTKLLGNIKRKDKCNLKIVALTRTDIFLNSNLVNVTSCINDNCVELDWTYSNENEFRYSALYNMMNRVLGWDGLSDKKPSDIYLGFTMPYPKNRPLKADMYIQRLSRLRPRDIVKLLQLIQVQCKKRGIANPNSTLLDSSELITQYSNYYTDQVKSEMMFRFSNDTIKSIFELVKTINTDIIAENRFESLYKQHCSHYPEFRDIFKNHRELIDFLFSLDVIGWTEVVGYERKNMHWHYREVKAIDEAYQLPWARFDNAVDPQLVIHRGACKHIVGIAKR